MPPSRCARCLYARRLFSTSRDSGLEAVPFHLSTAAAISAFSAWHATLSPLASRIVSVTPLYLPYWVFTARERASSVWLQYQPALSVYSGARIPRAIAASARLAPSSLHHAQPYTSSFLLSKPLGTVVEPFLLYEASAWGLAQAAYSAEHARARGFEEVRSRRVLAPAFVVEYTLLGGVPLTAYVPGVSGAVWGTAQQAPGARLYAYARGHAPGVQLPTAGTLGVLLELLARGSPQLAKALAFLAATLVRIAAPPLLVGALLLLGHTVVSPLIAQRSLAAAWEAQRAQEGRQQQGLKDEWRFREVVARARQDVRGAAASARRASGGRLPPPAPPGDLHALLGVGRGASREEITAGFRRELQKYHPDHAEAGGWDPTAASDRTRDIIEAYRSLRR